MSQTGKSKLGIRVLIGLAVLLQISGGSLVAISQIHEKRFSGLGTPGLISVVLPLAGALLYSNTLNPSDFGPRFARSTSVGLMTFAAMVVGYLLGAIISGVI